MQTMQMMNSTASTRKVPGLPRPTTKKEVRMPPRNPPPTPLRVDCL